MRIKSFCLKFIVICGLSTMVCGLIGCEAFVRKFVRKPKKEFLPQEEMVLAPVVYKAPEINKEKEYQQYFLYWKSWHDELINSLFSGSNHRKQLECVSETIKNLEQIRGLLKEESQGKLSGYITQINELKYAIEKDSYGVAVDSKRRSAERIKKSIIREFSWDKIKDLF